MRLWNARDGRCLRSWRAHAAVIRAVRWSPDGGLLASGSFDRTARIWSPDTGEEIACLEKQSNQIWSVAFSPDGTRLASASEDQTVYLWDISHLYQGAAPADRAGPNGAQDHRRLTGDRELASSRELTREPAHESAGGGHGVEPLADVVEEMIGVFRRGKAVIFCGAGFSRNSGLPVARSGRIRCRKARSIDPGARGPG